MNSLKVTIMHLKKESYHIWLVLDLKKAIMDPKKEAMFNIFLFLSLNLSRKLLEPRQFTFSDLLLVTLVLLPGDALLLDVISDLLFPRDAFRALDFASLLETFPFFTPGVFVSVPRD